MSAPDTCRKCGSQFRALLPGVGIQFGCATIVLPVGGYAEGLPCVMRQRDQLAERVSDAERERDHANDTANAVLKEDSALSARVKELEAYAERLEWAGDTLVAEGLSMDTLTRWHVAKETKP